MLKKLKGLYVDVVGQFLRSLPKDKKTTKIVTIEGPFVAPATEIKSIDVVMVEPIATPAVVDSPMLTGTTPIVIRPKAKKVVKKATKKPVKKATKKPAK